MIQPAFGLAESAQALDIQSLAASYGPWTGIRSNHVVDSNGRFFGIDGSSRSISTTEDRELLLALRERAELIVVDAATARLEQYRAPRSNTPLAIFSATGNFSNIPAVETSQLPIFLFTGDDSPRYATNQNVIAVSLNKRPFDGFLEWAKAQSINSILLEAGPTLSAIAFEAGVVSQSAVTRTGLSPDYDPILLANPFDARAKLVSLAIAPGASFSLWNH